MNAIEVHEFAVNLAKEAGEIIKEAFYKDKNVTTKSSYADVLTETDLEVENLIKNAVATKFPSHKFIGEETTYSDTKCVFTDDPTWIVDPVDGTCNFVHSFPECCVSIGVTHKKQAVRGRSGKAVKTLEWSLGDEVKTHVRTDDALIGVMPKSVVGVIYNPIHDTMYTAIRGNGAFCNNRPIKVSKTKDLCSALVISELGSGRNVDEMEIKVANFSNLIKHCHGIRCLGSAAMNMAAVACGSADAYVEHTIHCWDMAAAAVIITEAGGCIMDPTGGEFDLMSRKILCGSSRELCTLISNILSHCAPKRDDQ